MVAGAASIDAQRPARFKRHGCVKFGCGDCQSSVGVEVKVFAVPADLQHSCVIADIRSDFVEGQVARIEELRKAVGEK